MQTLFNLSIGIILIILSATFNSSCASDTFFVSSLVGNDTADCSACAPCRTPLAALDANHRTGVSQVVNLLPGRYKLSTRSSDLFVAEKLTLQGLKQYPNCSIYDGLMQNESVIIYGAIEAIKGSENYEPKLEIADVVFDLENTKQTWISSAMATFNLTRVSLMNEPDEIFAFFSTSKAYTTRLILENVETSAAHVNVSFGSVYTNPDKHYYVDIMIKNSNFSNGFKITPKTLKSSDSWRYPSLDVRISNTRMSSTNYAALNISAVVINQLDIERCTFAGVLQIFDRPLYRLDYPTTANSSHPVRVNINNSTFQKGSYILNGAKYNRAEFCGMNITMRFNRFMAPAQLQSSETAIRTMPCTASYMTEFFVDARGNFWGDESGPFSCCSPSSRGVSVTQADASSWCLLEDCSSLVAPIQGNMTSYSPSLCQQDPFCPLESYPLRYSAIGISLSIIFITSAVSLLLYRRIRRVTRQEEYLLPVDFVASISRLCSIINVALIIAATLNLIITSYTYVQYNQIHLWMLPALIFISAICGSRILCSLWSLMIFQKYRGESSLFVNTIVSSVVVFFAAVWHFSSSAGVYFDGLNSAIFFWIIYATYAAVEITIGIFSIVLQSKMMLQREFKEIRTIQKSVDSNPYGAITDLLSTPHIRKLALAGFLISLMALIMCFILTFVLPIIIMRRFQALEQLSSGATFAVSTITALLSCIFFRRKFYDPLFGTISVSITFATIGFLIESAIFSFLYAGKNDYYFPLMGLFITSALLLIVPAIIGAWLVAKLRAELTADIAQGVYARFASTLE